MIMETIPISLSHKLCNERGHPIVSLMESQWKLRLKHDHNFPMKGKPLQYKSEERNLKEQDFGSHSQGYDMSRKVNYLSKII